MGMILCWFGWHRWTYTVSKVGRVCPDCDKFEVIRVR